MEYRSYADLHQAIRRGRHAIPADIDLVVAIPRSGVIPATIIALALNVPLTDVDGLLANRLMGSGHTRKVKRPADAPSECRHVLVVDDSIYSGESLETVKQRIAAAGLSQRFTFAAIYATREAASKVDLYFEVCPFPRVFEWNLMHHHVLDTACVDIDGVLCLDPTEQENQDGEPYLTFLQNARPLHLPSRRVHHLVTSRLEKHRPETEAWLRRQGIEFGRLSMLDLPDAATRRRLGAHGKHKAEVFRRDEEADIFIESEKPQAVEIARRSGKPVICVDDNTFIRPNALSVPAVRQQMVQGRRGVTWFFRAGLRRIKAKIG